MSRPGAVATVPPHAAPGGLAPHDGRTGPEAPRRPVRRPIAVLLSRFPLVTETFILREIEELERQGQPVRLVPLLRERPAVVHREARAWVPRALFTPFLSPAILAANARALVRRPHRYLALLGRVVLGSLGSGNVLVRSVALFPKCVYLAERLEREGIRHIHAHYATHPATAAFIISALTPIRFSVTVHAHDLFVAWRRPLLRAKVRRACFIRVISAFNGTFLRALYPESTEKIRVIHMGIAPDAYRLAAGQGAGGEDGARLVCVASLQPYKGIPVLIEACRRLAAAGHRFRCDVVGEGRQRAELERRIAAAGLGDRVRLRGALRQDEIAALLGLATIVVLPSVVSRDGQMEGIPVALMEAMAAQRPVVASAISGIPELVEHGVNGLLVEPGNAVALAAAIAQLLAKPERGREMGRRGSDTVRLRFRLDAVTRSLRREIEAWNPPPDAAAVLRDLMDAAGFGGEALGVRRVHEGRDARVIEVVAADGRRARELVVKTHRARPDASRPAPQRARWEYDVLAGLGERFAGADGSEEIARGTALRTPRPLALRMDAASLVMERCAGERLDELIRRGRDAPGGEPWASLERAVDATGRWVRRLHGVTRREDPDAAARRWDGLIDAALRGATERRVGEAIRRRLGELRRRPPSGVALVGCHGDLSPGNILGTATAVTVVDFEGYHEGLPWEDAGDFLVHLELYFAAPWRAGRLTRLRDVFLGAAGLPPDPAGLELCRTIAVVRALARLRASSWRLWPQALLLRHLALGKRREGA